MPHVRERRDRWGNVDEALKTPAAVRDIDLHSALAGMLREFIGLSRHQRGRVALLSRTSAREPHGSSHKRDVPRRDRSRTELDLQSTTINQF